MADVARRLGLVVEDDASQLTQITVPAEVTAPLVDHGTTADRVRARATELLENVGLGNQDAARNRTWELSGGQQHRAAMAAAPAGDPRVLILRFRRRAGPRPGCLSAGPAAAKPAAEELPAASTLSGFSVLPADTLVSGSEPLGAFLPGRTPPVCPGRPVQDFSGVRAAGNGTYLAMSDNGFGSKADSRDCLLSVHRTAPGLEGGRTRVLETMTLSAPRATSLGRSGATAVARPPQTCRPAASAPPRTGC